MPTSYLIDAKGVVRYVHPGFRKGDIVEIKKQIRFKTNSAKIIGAISFEILDQVAGVFESNPEIKVVIEGHTDSRGRDAYNERLSQARADAVRQYLIEQGITATRMTSRGYGETSPIESNRTAAGRAANPTAPLPRCSVLQSRRRTGFERPRGNRRSRLKSRVRDPPR